MKGGTIKVLAVATVLAFMCMAFACVGANNGDGKKINESVSTSYDDSGTDGGIDWEYDDDANVLRISASAHPEEGYEAGVMKDYSTDYHYRAPWDPTIHRYSDDCRLIVKDGVRNIGAYAFIEYDSDKDFKGSLFLPDSVTEIGSHAFDSSGFDCKLVTSATIIDAYAFNNCKLRGDLDLSKTEYIEHDAFSNCDAFDGTLTIGASYIGDYAFAKCGHLTGIFFVNEEIEYLGSYAFAGCESVSELSLKAVNKIDSAYSYAFGLTQFVDENNVPIDPDRDLCVLHGMDFTGRFDGIMVRCN